MSTPQGPQPPNGAPQQPAEQPAWAQQAAGAWGAAPNGHARRDDETRAVPRWNAPETSEVPQQDAGDHANGEAHLARGDGAAPAQEVPDTGDSTQVVARGGQQGWNLDETRIEPRIVSQPEIRQDGAAQHQGWGPGEQAHAAPPYASPEQHYGAQQGQPAWGQQYPGQGHPQAQHAQPQAHQAQPASPFAPPGQHDPYGQAQPGSGQPSYGHAYAAQPGHPAQPAQPGQAAQPGQPGQPYGQQPTQQFGQPQFGQQSQQGQQQAGQQSPWSGQQAGWAPGGPSQQPAQQWGGWPDAQQQWGPSYPSQPGSAAAKSRRTLFMGIGAVVLVVVVGVLGFVAPGFFLQRVLDAAAVQEGVRQVLTQDYGLQVESVTCPEGTAVVADTAFECTAVVDGEQIAVPIRITSGDGNYEVGRPD